MNKNFIRKIIPKRLKEFINRTEFSKYQNLPSYSVNGEDLLLYSYLKDIKKGFYVDIGAHHPFRFSNTFLFYQLGWSGINIDALPGSMTLFNKFRNRDINLEIGISSKKEILTYYQFEENAYNTFSKEFANKYIKNNIKLVEKHSITTYPLKDILDKYLNTFEITFLCIDVEGLDLAILQSNNWDKYKPKYIFVEENNVELFKIENNSIVNFLKEKKYELLSVYKNNLFFKLII
ncbi:MAG: FkbM family methyltransferase [Bacteroidales bacterium]|nr:FkbM family methyltransferase [Bacteroidales bacterium]